MKNILSTICFCIISSVVCKAQMLHSTADVKLTLPSGTYRLTKQQADGMPESKLSNKSNTSYAPPYAYKKDGLFIGIYNPNKDSVNNDLPREKRFQDEGYKFLKKYGNNTYHSFYKNFGVNRVLIINYVVNGIGHYWFFYQNESKALTQAGYIDYPKAEGEKATDVLNKMLSSIEFTK